MTAHRWWRRSERACQQYAGPPGRPARGTSVLRALSHLTDRGEHRARLVLGLFPLVRGDRVRHDAGPRLDRRDAVRYHAGADGDREIHAPVARRDVANRARVRAAAL